MSSEDGQSLVEETQPQSSMGPSMPPLTRQAVDDCAFENWFPNFKRVSPKATIIQLTQEFIDYLRADGVFLPGDCDSWVRCVESAQSWLTVFSENRMMLRPMEIQTTKIRSRAGTSTLGTSRSELIK